MPKQKQNNHVPVLLREVMDGLAPKEGEVYLDLTAGYGGHASEILEETKSSAVLVDRDSNAIAVLKEKFRDDKVSIIHSDFLSASRQLEEQGAKYDIIIADIGVSSPHLDNIDRGFSMKNDGPLDMRMDQSQKLTAEEVVNSYPAEELVRILKDYGQEPKARLISRLIIDNRPFHSTQELAEVVAKAWPGYSRVHPATRTFQAIRIAVNEELEQLAKSLPVWLKLLNPGGRLAVISFHSLEDAIVKDFFREHGGDRYDADLEVLTAKPVTASDNELVTNPRARSARLRVSKRK